MLTIAALATLLRDGRNAHLEPDSARKNSQSTSVTRVTNNAATRRMVLMS